MNSAFVPLHGSERYIGVDAWRHDPAFVGGSHERGGSTSNASILREHSASVAAAQVGAQEVVGRREGNWNRHREHGREREGYGRHDHDRHMRGSANRYLYVRRRKR